MKSFLAVCLLVVSGMFCFAADEASNKADQLARDVWKASGGENWPKVKALRFTFGVEGDGKTLMSAEHHWDVAAGTDEVQWKGKDVTVNLMAPTQDENGKAAYARWVNDSYWLMAPLKVLDRGVHRKYEGTKEIDGGTFEMLRLSFDQIGLTPNDQYILYIDPKTKLVHSWDYIPKSDTVMHAMWDNYQTFGGLTLATEHSFAGKMIRLSNIEVTTE